MPTGGRENSHTTKSDLFCLQQPKMDSFLPLLSASSLRQERMESLKSWHNESERGESECEGEGRAVKVQASALTAFSCSLTELCWGPRVSLLLPLQGLTDVAAAVSTDPDLFLPTVQISILDTATAFPHLTPTCPYPRLWEIKGKLRTGCHVLTDGPRCQ